MQKHLLFKENLYSLKLVRLPIFLLLAVLTLIVARIPTATRLKRHQELLISETSRRAPSSIEKQSAYVVRIPSGGKPYVLPPEDPRLTAALSGNVKAQADIGAAYALAQGVEPDYTVASTWLILAKANGDRGAETLLRQLTPKLNESEIGRIRWNLGEMYANGFGVRADKVTAYMWHCVAEAAGEDRSKSAISQLTSTMTRTQVMEAKARASQWLRGHGVSARVPCLATDRAN